MCPSSRRRLSDASPPCPPLLPSALLNLLTVSTVPSSPGRRPPSTPPGPRITSLRRFYLPTFLSLQARRAPGPRPHTLPVAHSTSFTDASGALLTITSPAIGRRIDKVEISSFSPCSDSCLAISRPMVRWGEAPHLPIHTFLVCQSSFATARDQHLLSHKTPLILMTTTLFWRSNKGREQIIRSNLHTPPVGAANPADLPLPAVAAETIDARCLFKVIPRSWE